MARHQIDQHDLAALGLDHLAAHYLVEPVIRSLHQDLGTEAANQLEQDGAVPLFGEREISQLMAEFFWGLTHKEKAEQWAQDAVAGGSATLRDSALKVLKRLGVYVKEPLKYAGEDLRGRDFSGKNLRYADFTGATLDANGGEVMP